MLTASALAFVAVLGGAAAADLPIAQAFGLRFGERVPDAVVGASLGTPPYPVPPGNLEQRLPEPVPGQPSDWYLFRPDARPSLLDDPDARFMVLRGAHGHPVRILAEHPRPNCVEDMLWLTRSLGRKYQAEDDPYGANRTGFRESARFVSGTTQIDVSCGPTLLIEYTDAAEYARWLEVRESQAHAYHQRQSALAEEQARLQDERRRRLADAVAGGDRFRISGAFGVTFGVPVDPTWMDPGPIVADQALPAHPPQLPAALPGGTFTFTVGPDLVPVQVAGEFADTDAALFRELAAAMRVKYGPPAKDSPVHKIFKVNGDYAVVRYLPDRGVARLVLIDAAGRAAQKARQAAAELARLAEQERQFEEETAGL